MMSLKILCISVLLLLFPPSESSQTNMLQWQKTKMKNQFLPYKKGRIQSQQAKYQFESAETVYLEQNVPKNVIINNNSYSETTNKNKKKKFFIIDARPLLKEKSQNDQKINFIISLNDQNDANLENIVKDVEIQSFEWNERQKQFQTRMFPINQLTIDKHNLFYSLLLPTLGQGKYKVTITLNKEFDHPIKLSVKYHHILLHVQKSQMSPVTRVNFTESSRLFIPMNSLLQIPIYSPQQSLLLHFQSCSFHQPIFWITQEKNLSHMTQLKDKVSKGDITLVKHSYSQLQPLIYVKNIQSTGFLLYVGSSHSIQDPFNYLLLKVQRNHKSPFKSYFKQIKMSSKLISYQVKGDNLEISYKKVDLNINKMSEEQLKKIKELKIVYRLYISSNEDSLAKRFLCWLNHYQKGQETIVLEKDIISESLKNFVQVRKQKLKQLIKVNETETYKTSFSQLKGQLQSNSSKLYIAIKASLQPEDTQVFSQFRQENGKILRGNGQNLIEYNYESVELEVKYINERTFWQSVSFSKIMWIFMAVSLMLTFIIFFIQNICRNWRKNITNRSLKQETNNPSIVISQQKNNDVSNKALSDSYGFYPSPPSSYSNIMKAYGFDKSDQIKENDESHQRSPKQIQIVEQPMSPLRI